MNSDTFFYDNLVQSIIAEGLVCENDRILLALSGGPDSVFLFYLLKEIQKNMPISIYAVHVNHHLRGDNSDADQLFVQQLTDSLDVPLAVCHVDVQSFAAQHQVSIEMAARELRYQCILKQAQNDNCMKIVIAHTADDRVETAMMRLINGASLKGITGLRYQRHLDSYMLIRPILKCWKKDILEWLHNHKIQYCIDASNESSIYMRNKVRNKLIPLIEKEFNPAFRETLFSTLDVLGGQCDVFHSIVSDYQQKALLRNDFLHVYNKEILRELHSTLICAIVMQSLYALAEEPIRLASAQFDTLIQHMDSTEHKLFEFPGQCVAILDRSYLIIAKKNKIDPFFDFHEDIQQLSLSETVIFKQQSGLPISIECKCATLTYDREVPESMSAHEIYDCLLCGQQIDLYAVLPEKVLMQNCYLMFRKQGDRIRLKAGIKKLKKYFIDMGVPPLLRNVLPVICADGLIIWIPGMQLSHYNDKKSLVLVKISLKV